MHEIYWTHLLKLGLERYVIKDSVDSTDSGCYRMTRNFRMS